MMWSLLNCRLSVNGLVASCLQGNPNDDSERKIPDRIYAYDVYALLDML